MNQLASFGNQLAATVAAIGVLLFAAIWIAGWAVDKAAKAELDEIERDQM